VAIERADTHSGLASNLIAVDCVEAIASKQSGRGPHQRISRLLG
jgi:hypothetical protein